MKKMKRWLSMLLMVSMVLTMLVPGVSAAEPEENLENVALGAKVTSGWTNENIKHFDEETKPEFVTDGDTMANPGVGENNTFCLNRRSVANGNPGKPEDMHLTIDLGAAYEISQITYYGYDDPNIVCKTADALFMISNDPEFPENNRTIVFNNDKGNIWGFGAGEDDVIANEAGIGYEIRLNTPVTGRYVRFYQRHTIWDKVENTWEWLTATEIEVYGTLPLEPTNVAEGKIVTSGWDPENIKHFDEETKPEFVTDGDTMANPGVGENNTFCLNRRSVANGNPGNPEDMHLTIDLGKNYDIEEIVYYGYDDANVVCKTADALFMISDDPEFPEDNRTIVFNNDEGNIWGFGAGEDDVIANEAGCGYGIQLDTPVAGRYVRFYQRHTIWDKVENTWEWLTATEIEVYAKPDPSDMLTVSFDYACDEYENKTVELMYYRKAVKPQDPEWGGYIFQGWTLDGEPYDFNQPVTESITLVASWKEVVSFDVTFKLNNGEDDIVVRVNEGDLVKLPGNPYKAGYNFAGWKVNGEPFNPSTPITGPLTVEATWVESQTEDAVKIAAGLVDYYLDTTGKITNIVSRINNTDYAPAGEHQKSNLISIIANGAFHEPTKLTYADNTLTFEFASANTVIEVGVEQKGSYTNFTVEKVIAPPSVYVETVLWGPIKNTIGEVVGEAMGVAYDWEFGLGLHSLNDKTVSGWPMEWINLSYRPGPYQQDDTYLAGMSWQAQAAVVAPLKYEGQDDPNSRVYNPNNPEGGWGGSFLQAFTNNYTKPSDRVVGGYPWINDWGGNYKNFDQANFDLYHSYTVVAKQTVHPLVNAAFPEDAYLEGSSIALFGCKTRNILNTLEEIELGEGLPHPTIDGQWIKKAPATKGAESSGNSSTGNIDAIAKAAADAGIKYVYNIKGAVGPFDHNGSFRYDGNWGHSDYNAQTMMCDVAAKYGVYMGTHSMSDYIGNYTDIDNLYITDYGAHPNLASAQTTVLTRPAAAGDNVLYIADGANFGEIYRGNQGGSKVLRIGTELVVYSGVTKLSDTEWQITGCQRGALTTKAAAYEAGASVDRMWKSIYGSFLGGESLMKDVGTRQAQAFNNAGVKDMSCDGLEDAYKAGYNQLSMNRYASTLWDGCNNTDGFYFVNSMMVANQWDMLSFERWNGPVANALPNFNVAAASDQGDRVTDPRAYMMRRNLFAQVYGVNTSSAVSMNRDMSAIAALDAGVNVGYLTGMPMAQRAQMKAWLDAIQHNAFTQQQKQDFFNAYVARNVGWTLETVTENQEWKLQKTDMSGTPVGDPINVIAGGDLNVADVEGGNVATTLSVANVKGINPDHTNKLKAGFAATIDLLAQAGDVVIVSPQADMGYVCNGVTVTDENGNEIALTARADGYGNYEFTMPQGDITITPDFVKDADFKAIEVFYTEEALEGNFNITTGETANGTISVDANADAGSTVTVTAEAAEGYRFSQANVSAENGETVFVESTDKAVFTMPESNVTVTGIFVPEFTVETETVTADLDVAIEGDLVVVNVAAPAGQKLVPGSLIVKAADGTYIPTHVCYDNGNYNKYEFSMPASDVTVTAEFVDAETRNVKVEAANGGTAIVSTETAKKGETVEFTVTADFGVVSSVYVLDNGGNQPTKIIADEGVFRFNSNRINGDKTEVKGSFVMPDGDVTVYAYFEQTVEQVAANLKLEDPAKGDTMLKMPEVPAGFTVEIVSVKPEGVIDTDWSIQIPAADTEVEVTMLVTKNVDGTTAQAVDSVVVPTVTLEELLDNLKLDLYQPQNDTGRVEIPAAPNGYEFNLIASSNPEYIALDGTITRPENDVRVTLTIEVTHGEEKATKDFVIYLNGSTELPLENVTLGGFGSEETSSGADYAANAFDGNPNTMWHTDWSGTAMSNQWIVAKLSEPMMIDGLRCLPRASGSNGVITQYSIYVSMDNENWTQVVKSAQWSGTQGWKDATFAPVEAQYVKLQAEATMGGNKYASAAEIRITPCTEEEVPAADKSALEALYNENVDKENENYTEESWTAFQTALTEAKTVLDKAEATQEEVDAAKAALEAAIAGLAEKPVVKEETVVVRAVVNGDKSTAKTIFTGKAPHGANLVEWLNENVTVEPRTGYEADTWYNWDWFGHKHNDKATVNGWTNVYVNYNKLERVIVKAVVDGNKDTAEVIWTGYAKKGVNLVEFLNKNVKVEDREGYTVDKWYNWDWFGHKHSEKTTVNGWTNVYVTYNKIPMVNVVVKAVENGDKSTAKTIWSGKAPKGAVLTEWLTENVKVSVPDGFTWDNTWMNWDWFGHKHNDKATFNGWTNVYVNFTNK